jgi:hypothetical protein
MEDAELYEILGSYKNALDQILQRLDQMDKMNEDWKREVDEQIHDLRKTLFDDILTPAQEAMDAANREKAYEEFSGKYAEKFAPYLEGAKAIEGEDFDLTREAFDQYNAIEGEKPGEEEYVDVLLSKVAEQIDAVKKALGAEEIEIKQDENGETEIKADGEEVNPEDLEKAAEGGEGEGEGEGNGEGEGEGVEDEEPADSPEDIAALEKELEAYKG